MALTIEDGTIVTGANSYQDVSDLRTYAALRGVDVTGQADADVEVLLIKAMDYIEAQRDRFQGIKVDADQGLQWPRSGVWVDGLSIAHTDIPRELKYAQLSLALEALNHDLQPNRLPEDKGRVVKEKVGELEVVYEKDTTPNQVPAFAKGHALLSVLYKRNGLTLVRS